MVKDGSVKLENKQCGMSMIITNIFKINELPVKKFFTIIISANLFFFGSVMLDNLIRNAYTGLLRALIVSLYLLFIPGYIILRLLKIRGLTTTETISYALGFSISFLMYFGLFINVISNYLDIINPPFIESHLIPLFFVSINMLLIITYFGMNREVEYKVSYLYISSSTYKYYLGILTLPFITIFGSYLVTNWDNPSLLILEALLILVIMTIVIIKIERVPNIMIPFMVVMLSLSLLWHTSLVSHWLWGRDVFNEFYITRLTMLNSKWNPNFIAEPVNSALSVSILPVILSRLSDISVTWIFKGMYPFIYSFFPLLLYTLFERVAQSKRIAFFSVAVFMSSISFYYELPTLLRQEIAEVFLGLLLVTYFNVKLLPSQKRWIYLILFPSLLFSHYGTAFIYLFLVVFGMVLSKILGNHIRFRLSYYNRDNNSLSIPIILTFLIFSIIWYKRVARGIVFTIGVRKVTSAVFALFGMFMGIKRASPVISLSSHNNYISISLIVKLNLLLMILVTVGLVYTTFRSKKIFNIVYLAYSWVMLILVGVAWLVPSIARIFTFTRLYHFALILLVVFFPIGIVNLIKNNKLQISLLLIFVLIFYSVNSGLLGLVLQEPISISLSPSADWPKYTCRDVTAALWVTTFKEPLNAFVYADVYRWPLIGGFDWTHTSEIFCSSNSPLMLIEHSYLYLGTYNLKNKLLLCHSGRLSGGFYVRLPEAIMISKSWIYQNSGAMILT